MSDSRLRGLNVVLVLVITGLLGTTGVGVGMAAAEEQPVRLIFNGATVPRGTRSAVETVAQMPGFSCSGYHSVTSLKTADPATTLRIVDNHFEEGSGFEAFDGLCRAPHGEPFGEEVTESGRHGIFAKVTITSSAIGETFSPAPIVEDPETKCRWKLATLSGPLPASGVLNDVSVSGTAGLQAYSARSCPKAPQPVTGTLIVDEANEEGAPIGAYTVEVL